MWGGGGHEDEQVYSVYIYSVIYFAFFPGNLQPRFVAPRQTTNVGGAATISLRVSKQSATGGMIVGHRVGEVLRNCSCAWSGLALIVLLVFCRT